MKKEEQDQLPEEAVEEIERVVDEAGNELLEELLAKAEVQDNYKTYPSGYDSKKQGSGYTRKSLSTVRKNKKKKKKTRAKSRQFK